MCKKPVVAEITQGGDTWTCSAYYHPRGCMGARREHLDMSPDCSPLLRELGFKHGMSLPCVSSGNCILVLNIPVLRVEVVIRGVDACLSCSGSVYVMNTRSGMVYLGGVRLTNIS